MTKVQRCFARCLFPYLCCLRASEEEMHHCLIFTTTMTLSRRVNVSVFQFFTHRKGILEGFPHHHFCLREAFDCLYIFFLINPHWGLIDLLGVRVKL